MNMPEMIEELFEVQNDKESRAALIAKESMIQSISSGARLCAIIGGTVWERGTYVNPITGERGFMHQALEGNPGTKWNKFYNTLTGIIFEEQYPKPPV